jgi:lysine/ornithine N-monooxygenase
LIRKIQKINIDNTELKIEINKSVFNEKLRANSYDDYLKNISEVLSKMLIQNNFINYEGIKFSSLKEIQWDIIEAETFWFFRKLILI